MLFYNDDKNKIEIFNVTISLKYTSKISIMNSLLLLPYDMQSYIVTFIENKIHLSMICKQFLELLQKMFDNKQLINYNDPYYVRKYYSSYNILEITPHVPYVKDYKILNYVYKLSTNSSLGQLIQIDNMDMFERDKLSTALLHQNCIVDNTDMLYELLQRTSCNMWKTYFNFDNKYYNNQISTHYRYSQFIQSSLLPKFVLLFAINHKSYKIVLLLISLDNGYSTFYVWADYVRHRLRYSIIDSDIDDVIAEIEYFKDNIRISLREIQQYILQGIEENKNTQKVSDYFNKIKLI
jgi:hypothetical protein